MKEVTAAAMGLAFLLGPDAPAATGAERPGLAVRMDTPAEAEVVVHLEVEDRTPLDEPHTVTAATLQIDGKANQEILLLPGSGRDRYEALVGPLPAGRHLLEVRPSDFWPADPRLAWKRLDARAVAPGDPDHEVLRLSPRFWLRADTVGETTDLPLLLYVEEEAAGADRRLRYTVVFSNEDGGTPARALLARWGRATDIELAYEAVVAPDGSLAAERFQGTDHDLRPFKGRRAGAHPVLLVATLNNLFLDRGRSGALVSPVPARVRADAGTRESVMDAHPWTYRVMAKELEREGKIAPGRGVKRDQVVDDPRRYVYAEARLRLEGAAVAARAGLADGSARSSHGGDPRLAIARDGWVRTAIPLGESEAPLAAVSWECLTRENDPDDARCEIEATRAFRLDASFRPGPNLVQPALLRLEGGQAGLLRLLP